MAISTYDDLKFDVQRRGGVNCYNMRTLREVHGAGKLGPTVIDNISKHLDSIGLGHFPELSLNQWVDVRVYEKSGQIGLFIEAVKDISPQGDAVLRSISDSADRAKTIKKLKELVGDL